MNPQSIATARSAASPDTRPRGAWAPVAVTVVVLSVLAAVHTGAGAPVPSLLTSIRDGAVLLPLALVAAATAALLSGLMKGTTSRACSSLASALGGGAVLALLSLPANAAQQYLFSPQLPAPSLTHGLSEAVLTWLAASTALLCVAQGPRVVRACRAVRPAHPVAVSVAVALAAQTGVLVVAATPAAAAPAPSCVQTRSYDVAVINLAIPFNRWGDRDANGMMYVLQLDKDAVKNWDVPLGKKRGATMGTYVDLAPGEAELAGGRRLRPRPLILRANIGDCVKVTVTNELTGPQLGGTLTDPRVSMQVNGAAYDVQTSDGSAVGFNTDTTIAVGQSLTYTWAAPAQEGVFLIRDRGIPAGSEGDGGSVVHGLFGGLAVEPVGSTWADPVSGARLDSATPYMDPITRRQSGDLYIGADITPPTPAGQVPQSFRESVQLAQDEIPGIGFGFNYGSEPGDRREANLCPDCVGEETSLSSWVYGDPALVKLASGPGPWKPTPGRTDLEDCGLAVLAADGTPRKDKAGKTLVSCYTANVTHAYKKDKTKVRYGLAGVKETHVFHMHAHQWLAEPEDNKTTANGNPESITVDSQTFGPGEMFTADLIGGAGSVPGTAGDTIFHCHLYPHFAEGFWALLRVHDVLEDGTGALPDGINVRNLEPLPGGLLPVKPTADNPGYPRFIPGKVGWRAPQPFGGVSQANGTPDNPATVEREDLALAPRMVAGRVLDPSLLEKEQKITTSTAAVKEVQQVSHASTSAQEVQTLSVDATGGTFAVVGDPLAEALPATDVSATATATLDAAVERATGKVVTTTPVAGATAWQITFDVPADVPPLVVDGTKLTKPDPTNATLTVAGSAQVTTTTAGRDGGRFRLRLGADPAAPTTADLPFDATAAQVQTALTPLVAVTVTDVATTAPDRGWRVSFTEAKNQPPLEAAWSPGYPGVGLLSTVTVTEGALAGTFALSFNGQTTDPALPDGSTATQVEAALEKLTTLQDVTVVGTGAAGDPYRVRLIAFGATTDLVIGTSPTAKNVPDPALVGADAADVASRLALERSTLRKGYGGAQPKPGAPLTDPCPAGARQVVYNVSVIQRELVYNEAGWRDTQGRLYVLDKDVAAVMAGTKKPEPLFFRVNAGDCVAFNLTNRLPNWTGGDAFVQLAQANMIGGHVHLVKFDVLGSDGSSNGWNYQQAAFTEDQAAFNNRIAAGTASCTVAATCRLPKPASFNPENAPIASGQTISERWYADRELRTAFTHDHHFPALVQNRGQYGALVIEPKGVDTRNPQTGEYYQPINNPANGPVCGSACTGSADGTQRDIVGPGTNDDFREFGMSFQDFVPLTKKGGDPRLRSDTLNPPAAPELYPDADPGVMGINYTNAPFLLRDTKNGLPVDPAYRFSSTVFGDPATPLLQAYAGDPVRIRLIQGSQEEQNVWSMNGTRWRDEPDDPQAPLVNSKALGISDAMNFEVPQMACGIDEDCRGDYLYSSTSIDATYLGMWGLMRVYGKGTPKLLPLPDNTPQAANGNLNQTVTGLPPDPVPAGKRGGTPCPTTASTRTFDVFATDGKIVYNKAGDNDPYGLMYGLVQPGETPDQAVARVRTQQEPLVLRANAGDCIQVTLTNRIDPAGAFAAQHADQGVAKTATGGDPALPLEPPTGTKAGLRISLHPQLVQYDVRYSDGATVGFNKDQTVGPGQTITQRWWADEVSPGELGATNLVDFGDVRGHRHHGLFAGLVIEPKGSAYTDPISGEPVSSGTSADIRVPNAADFRENVPFFQDGLNLRDVTGAAILPPSNPAHPAVTLDAEDDGEKAFSYRSAAFRHRGDPLHEMPGASTGAMSGSALADVFSSKVNGDPDTKIFRAYGGDPVRMRVLQGSDKPRMHSFQMAAQAWRAQPDDPGSRLVGSQGGMSVMRALNVQLASAGGLYGKPGDYMYNCGVSFHHLSGGLWGISRVYAAPAPGFFVPSALGSGKDPATADNPLRPTLLNEPPYRPIQPLEQRTVKAVVFDDSNINRLRGSDEKLLAGVPVELHAGNPDGTTGALLETRKTDLTGRAAFSVPVGAYDLVVPAPADFAATTPKTMRLTATKDGATQSADFGQVQLANLAVRAYNDQDGSATYTAGEASMEGWNVTLTGQATTASKLVTGGVAAFGDLLPGSYNATVTPGAGYYSTTHKAMPVSITVPENADLTGNPVAGQPGTGEIRVGYALKAGVSVRVFNDSNDNGTQEAGESSLTGRRLDVKGGPEGAVLATTTTDAAGNATLDDPDPAIDGLVPGTYRVTETPGTDWRLTDKASRVVTRADGTTAAREQLPATGSTVTLGVQERTSQIVTLPNYNPKGWVSAVPFNDLNNDGVRQDKEGKLVGWHAELYLNGVLKGATSTNNSGVATWYVDQAGGIQAPVSYTVKMSPQEVLSTEIPWTATTSGSVTVGAVSGEDRSTSFGFVQLGTIQAIVWHDLDKDGIDSAREQVQADRTVRLYDSGGKTLLQQKVTDASGMASFKASAGIDYQLEVLLPTGWTATAPFAANGTPVTKLKVAGPTGLASVLTRFGQYNTNDRTPPPDPTATAAAGTNGVQTVTLTSEAGASFRYTLDGDLPSATTGMTYNGPVTISASKTLKAVAIDTAGNASGVTVADYVVVGGTTAPSAAPGTWTPTAGTTRGVLFDLAVKDDGLRYYLTSAASGSSYVTDGYGTYVVPTTQRKLLGLGVIFKGRASISGVTRSLEMYNWATKKYEVVRATEAATLTDSSTIVDVSGDPTRFMSATTGEIRLKVRGDAAARFEIGADQVAYTVRYTP